MCECRCPDLHAETKSARLFFYGTWACCVGLTIKGELFAFLLCGGVFTLGMLEFIIEQLHQRLRDILVG